MLKYLNGAFKDQILPNERVLLLVLGDDGLQLKGMLPTILDTYKKFMTCICFKGGENEQYEMAEAFKAIHKAGMKTCLFTKLTELSQVHKNVLDELDYIELNGKLMAKTYNPLDDMEDWYDV